MQIIKTIKEINNQVVVLKKEGKNIGFAPTMGALHAGHITLIRQSRKENDVTVCSIFVNPTQFNDPKDFDKYPITLEKDMQQLVAAKCDILFLPSVAEMYPKGYGNKEKLDFGFLNNTLEGEFRPGHFDGMAQIVEKLLLAVEPTRLYMGQKDYQQAMICTELIKKRKMKTKLVLCPIKREKDGLAMSSRNVRLDKRSRAKAVEIVKVLRGVKRVVGQQTTDHGPRATASRRSTVDGQRIADIEQKAFKKLSSFPEFKVEYVAIRNAKTLRSVKVIDGKTPLVALVAAWIGGVRLIDNMLL
ncbi:MAG: pantoate--beta-alanine ligase [Bacteroidetes bacterium]|nr:pantoate--beta-alanine ligase [Bacteroidota bacterium]